MKTQKKVTFKKDLYGLGRTLEIQMRKAGVEVRLNTEVTPELAAAESPDVLVLAVGAAPVLPAIPGIDGGKTIQIDSLSDGGVAIGQKVVVLGGGLSGCEAAVHLAMEGKEVTVVEMTANVAVDGNVRHRPVLLEMMAGLNVRVETSMKGIEVNDQGLVCLDADGNEKLFEADTIVCSAGRRPQREVVNGLFDAAPEVVLVGDCIKPQKVTEAIFRGYHAGLDI